MQVTLKNNLFFISMLLLLSLSVVACKPKSDSELYGTYVADYKIAKEKLTLNKDGTFVQEVTLKATNKIDIAQGRWTYNPQTGYVFLENHMAVLDGYGELRPDYAHPSSGLAAQPADKYFGRILIGAAEGILYKKTD